MLEEVVTNNHQQIRKMRVTIFTWFRWIQIIEDYVVLENLLNEEHALSSDKLFSFYPQFQLKPRFISISRSDINGLYVQACKLAKMQVKASWHEPLEVHATDYATRLLEVYGLFNTPPVLCELKRRRVQQAANMRIHRAKGKGWSSWTRIRKRKKKVRKVLRKRKIMEMGIRIRKQFKESMQNNIDDWDITKPIPTLVKWITTDGQRINFLLERMETTCISWMNDVYRLEKSKMYYNTTNTLVYGHHLNLFVTLLIFSPGKHPRYRCAKFYISNCLRSSWSWTEFGCSIGDYWNTLRSRLVVVNLSRNRTISFEHFSGRVSSSNSDAVCNWLGKWATKP